MEDKIIIKITKVPTWEIVAEIRDKVRLILAGMTDHIVDSSEMVAAELVENAVKYGASIEGAPSVDFFFEYNAADKKVTVKVVSGIGAVGNLNKLKETIDTIKKSDDKAALYTGRLMEMMENPKLSESGLGLYRMAYEGEFDLDYDIKENVLKIIATRKI